VNYENVELPAKVRNLPFDCSTGSQLRVNGLMLKLFSFSVRGELVEPQKNTFARGSVIREDLRRGGFRRPDDY